MPKVDWRFACHKILAKVKKNDMYHKLIGMHAWMVEQVSKEWKSQDPIGGGKVWCRWPDNNLAFLSKIRYLLGGSWCMDSL